MPMRTELHKIFHNAPLSEYLAEIDQKIRSEIAAKPDDAILELNEAEYRRYLFEKHKIDVPSIDFDSLQMDSDIERVTLGPSHYLHARGANNTRDAVKCYLPYSGDIALIKYRPSSFIAWTCDVAIGAEAVILYVAVQAYNPETIRNDIDIIVGNFRKLFESLVQDLLSFNPGLPGFIEQELARRKQGIHQKGELLSSVGIPLKRRDSLPDTYDVPVLQPRKRITPRPTEEADKRASEPALDDAMYQEILQVMHDTGVLFERMPSLYRNKREEEIRDLFLFQLEGRFEGPATGETFHKSGKTDIYLPYKDSRVFIAECKFWAGQHKYLTECIPQLLGYLTWRNSKAAIVLFVRQKGFSRILDTVKQETPKHSNYSGFVDEKDETWINYRFHLVDDPEREVRLAVLLFHTPASL